MNRATTINLYPARIVGGNRWRKLPSWTKLGITTLTAVLVLSASPTWSQSDQAAGQASHVRLVQNELVPGRQGPLHSVSITYSFPGLASVTISGFGQMPASGEVNYVTPDEVIQFFGPGGQPLEAVDLKQATQLMGGISSDYPSVRDFPERFRLGYWKKRTSFSDHALRVLNQQFTSGLLPSITGSQDEYILVTEYQPLANLPDGLFAQVSVLISHQKRKSDELAFRVQWKVREKRKLTTWRDQVSDETKRAAELFVGNLVTALQSADGEQR